MASTSETGHVKNVANFQTLISACTGYGSNYNPSRTALQLPALTTLHTDAQNSLATVNTVKATLTHAINTRQDAFDPLKKLCTRIVNALDASGASDKLVEDVKTINKKIQGKRSSKVNPEQENTISVSQQSYDSLAENFARLIALISTEVAYTPNETALQVATLQTTVDELSTVNTAVTTANTQYSNALIARNNVLYDPESGLVEIAADVKKYVKSVYGTAAPEYKQISGLEFTSLKK